MLALLVAVAAAAPPTAGAARVDVTPPAGTPMAGYYAARGADGTHDPLHATALVLEQDGTRVALVGLDLVTVTAEVVADARRLIQEQTGIPGTHVMVWATHSHTGPVVSDGRSRAGAFGGDHPLAVQFVRGLPAQIAGAVKQADAARVPARVRRAVGTEPGLAFNRRFHLTDGTVGWNPGKRNPKVVRPAGPTDDRVPVALVETADGKRPIACQVTFAMHLDTVGGTRFSADYPHQLGRCLQASLGDKLVPQFAMGCSGDVNHLNVASAAPQKGHGEAARIGTRLAAAVLRAVEHAEPASGPLRASAAVVELPAAAVTEAEVAAAGPVIAAATGGAKPAPKFLDQVKAFQAADVAERGGRPFRAEVQVIALGDDLAWVGLPGEIFNSLGTAVIAGSPFRQTAVVSLCNGSVGYVPDRVAYPQGNYEVVSARVAAGSGEKLVDEALRQLRTLYRP
jgi:hypothetical protein